jgi:autotransporter-associated beta strand protein
LNGGITNNSPNTQTINLPLTLVGGNQTIDTAAGNVVITGGIGQSVGGLGITKTGSGILVLSGQNTYTGCTTVLAGVLQVDSADALPDGSSLIVGDGAAFALGSSQDAAVALSTASLAARAAQSAAPSAPSQQAPVPATVAASPLVASANNDDAVHPTAVSGGQGPAFTPGPSPSGRGEQIAAVVNRAQAHDAVFQSFAARASVKTKGAAAILDFAGSWFGGQSDQKHDSSARAVDAVMFTLKKM